MPIIHKLDHFIVNQIAAGEVVERPASIVKELMENSIDADAKAITLEAENGGISFLRVTDNGTGMEEEDAKVSFQRHATSKISDADDLSNIQTLGFRGEALASICSVSQMEMMTRQRNALSGYRLVNHGGEMIRVEEAGCPEGTTILVRNLFYNAPARLKFLKSPRSETAAISELTAKLILAHPEISFKYISNGKIIYHSPGTNCLLDAILTIYGKDVKNELIAIDAKPAGSSLSVSGYVGKPSLARTNRSHQSFFVNGRYIKSPLLSQCVEEAARDQTMINHFPWCVLSIHLPSRDIDVNVHPSKTEIRFRDQKEIYQLLLKYLKGFLEEKPYIPSVNVQENQPESVQLDALPSVSSSSFSDMDSPDADHSEPDHSTTVSKDGESAAEDLSQMQKDIPLQMKEEMASRPMYIRKEEEDLRTSGMNAGKDDNPMDACRFMKMNIIGSAFSTFILAETDTNLYIIDQHAAHERLLYEKFKDAIQKQEVLSQQLSPPYVLEVTHDEYLVLSESLQNLSSVGFDMEPFGGKSFLVRAVPVLVKESGIRDLFRELLDQPDYKAGNTRLLLQKEDIIRMSCKKAVKANDKLSENEIRSLLRDLSRKKIPLTCPHGRPILITISRYELEKKFKRIV